MPKPKLTKERNAQKKLERKSRLAEQKKQIKRDHLAREIKYGALTLRRHEKDWRAMLIKIALPRAREDLEFAWHNFERVIDSKDFIISLLIDEIDDAEEQYMQNFRTHAENLDKLIEMFHDRIEELVVDNNNALEDLQTRCGTEIDDLKQSANYAVEYLKTMLYSLEMAKKEQDRMIRAEYYSKIDEEEVKNQIALQKLKGGLESNYQKVFEQTRNFIRDFNKKIKDRKKEHNVLRQQDDFMQDLIQRQLDQIRQFLESIRHLRQTYADMKQIEDHKLFDMQEEVDFFRETFNTLKSKLKIDLESDKKKLICLSEHCNLAFKNLEKLKKKGEKLLTIAAICRKLETIKEKILPFPLALRDIPEVKEKKNEPNKQEMELFWQRAGQAGCVQHAIREERMFLNHQNGFLAKKFLEYCDEAQFPSGSLVSTKTIGINVVDANHEMKKYKKFNSFF